MLINTNVVHNNCPERTQSVQSRALGGVCVCAKRCNSGGPRKEEEEEEEGYLGMSQA